MADATSGSIDNVMKEARLFPPPADFAAKARIGSLREYERMWREAADDLEGFWGRLAGELHWFEPYSKILDWKEPFARWFVGGQTNASYNCLDAHLDGPRRNKAAFIWEGEPGDTRVLTYQMLHHEVSKFANVLRGLGIGRGDVVSIYMPMVPELAIAMLACARIGAVHSRDLRRLFRRGHRRPQQRRPAPSCMITADCGLAARQAVAAEGERRRGPGEIAHGASSASCCGASGSDVPMQPGPRPLVARV